MAEINISRFALYLEILKSSEHEIWPSYREKQLKKYVQIRFFKFQFMWPEIPQWWQKNGFWPISAKTSHFSPEAANF